MWRVYYLYSKKINKYYIGKTNDLKRRLNEHNRGQSFFTRNFSDFILIYTEECVDYRQGRVREKYLKSGCGKKFLRSLIK